MTYELEQQGDSVKLAVTHETETGESLAATRSWPERM